MTRRKRHKFWTGLLTFGGELPQPKSPFRGSGWQAVLGSPWKKDRMMQHVHEVILFASSWMSAQRALNLIHGCHQLFKGDPEVFRIHHIAHNSHEPKWMDRDSHKTLLNNTFQTSNFPVACAIAAKASSRRKWTYAIIKYKFSMSLYSLHVVDLDPSTSPHLPISPFPDDHVMFSHAIISAYSAIEDLGLQVVANRRRPSRIGGKWNPDVKRDLERRLTKAGIDLTQTMPWTVRGPKRKIEMARPVPSAAKAAWAVWNVRDSELKIIDAIAYASWLRSCVASHTVKVLTQVLSSYDVINVQHLARRLLLESLGFWRWQEKKMVRAKGVGRKS